MLNRASRLAIKLLRGGSPPKTEYELFLELTRRHPSDKWSAHDYAEPYFRHFNRLQMVARAVLEIGVGGYENQEVGYTNPSLGGHSLRFWKDFFPYAEIFGIDIQDKRSLSEERIEILQGSQVDKEFLKSLVERTGTLDIIIDDGSHINHHVITTFQSLFPSLRTGGLYVVEDTQTSYWASDYGGDYNNRNNIETIMGYFKSLTDGLNHAEFPDPHYQPSSYDLNIKSISFCHNLIFVEKGENRFPSNMIRRQDS